MHPPGQVHTPLGSYTPLRKAGTPLQADTPWADTSPWADNPPAQYMLEYTHTHLHSACWDRVNKRAVRIPLECILVLDLYFNLTT